MIDISVYQVCVFLMFLCLLHAIAVSIIKSLGDSWHNMLTTQRFYFSKRVDWFAKAVKNPR